MCACACCRRRRFKQSLSPTSKLSATPSPAAAALMLAAGRFRFHPGLNAGRRCVCCVVPAAAAASLVGWAGGGGAPGVPAAALRNSQSLLNCRPPSKCLRWCGARCCLVVGAGGWLRSTEATTLPGGGVAVHVAAARAACSRYVELCVRLTCGGGVSIAQPTCRGHNQVFNSSYNDPTPNRGCFASTTAENTPCRHSADGLWDFELFDELI
jgi:hypothetical protein